MKRLLTLISIFILLVTPVFSQQLPEVYSIDNGIALHNIIIEKGKQTETKARVIMMLATSFPCEGLNMTQEVKGFINWGVRDKFYSTVPMRGTTTAEIVYKNTKHISHEDADEDLRFFREQFWAGDNSDTEYIYDINPKNGKFRIKANSTTGFTCLALEPNPNHPYKTVIAISDAPGTSGYPGAVMENDNVVMRVTTYFSFKVNIYYHHVKVRTFYWHSNIDKSFQYGDYYNIGYGVLHPEEE